MTAQDEQVATIREALMALQRPDAHAALDSLTTTLTQTQQENDDLAKIAADGNEREKALEAQAQQMEEALREIVKIGDETWGWSGREAGKVARRALPPAPQADGT